MFSELFNLVKTSFIWAVIIIGIAVVAGVVKGINEERDAVQQKEEYRRSSINKVKHASKQWDTEAKKRFLVILTSAYNNLVECMKIGIGNKGYRSKADLWIDIDGKVQEVFLDLEGLKEVYNYISSSLDDTR